jgi:hypothetical protein
MKVARIALLVLLAADTAADEVVLHSTTFETDPFQDGWGSNAPLSESGNDWTTADSFSPIHSIRAAEALWFSPEIPLTPFALYSTTFRASTAHEGLFGPLANVAYVYRTDPWAPNVLLLRGEHYETSTRILFFPPAIGSVHVDDVSIQAIDRATAASVLDGMFARLPRYTFTAEVGRHLHLPRTRARLAAGETLRVVMLGDSIVNDTSHSYFEPLVERMYPGSRLEIVTSVRGETGCWWFRETDPGTGIPRVQSWVLDHDPDLVLLGGISHGTQGLDFEIEACRDVIRQVRAIDDDVELVLMTEAAGGNDPYRDPQLVEELDPQGDDWRGRMFRLAAEEQVELVDLTLPWARYVLHSGQPHGWFKKDTWHMNDRGAAVVGKALEAYFAPATPDGDQDGIPDVTDPCPSDALNDADFDGLCAARDPDDDADGVADPLDCAPASHLAWAPPAEVSPCDVPGGGCLQLSRDGAGSGTLLEWAAPPGGTMFWYDVLRGPSPTAFVIAPGCVESEDGSDTRALDVHVPGAGAAFYYLVRARNLCGVGPAGAGVPLDEPACP